MKKIYLALLLLCVFFIEFAHGQQNNKEKSFLNWFDSEIGISNTDLINGTEVVEKYRSLPKHHKFYNINDFVLGNVTYINQNYYNVYLKYDIFNDFLIAKVAGKKKGGIIQLISSKVSRFYINGTTFVKIPRINKKGREGFAELMIDNKYFSLYRQHKKLKTINQYTAASYHKFTKIKNQFILKYKGENSFINHKKDVYNLFPELKNNLKANKSLRSAWRKNEIQLVFAEIQNLLSKK
ncbi:MAG: hypothetical protein V3U92_16775 [Cellulophaga sp.]